MHETPAFRSMVALGDSFTEGMCDLVGPDGHFRGWADRVAERLAVELAAAGGGAEFRYANLAVRGKLIGQIADEQGDAAVALGGELVTLAGGLNDVMRPGCDLDHVERTLGELAERLSTGARQLVLFYSVDPSRRMRGGARLLPQTLRLQRFVGELGKRDGVTVVDLFHVPAFDDPRMWAEDRLHFSAEGHRRVAEAVLQALSYEPSFDWREPLPPAAPVGRVTKLRADLRWLRIHVWPWLVRRVTGKSSGDGRPAKRPTLERFPA
ncbi:SGNH/GDSL hydrolase family protein [Kitasatospora sp. MAP5-34]|uniref:SGNH/GDSL hydrolase family protein n=1 Tax=Kitasatospora sp. MAP5-34 TaxID=3035102 RepID=UPI0024762F1E|nr:SGNH/GDSL hydrolase family protein [Kitasatospora sp. MAP5-34]MDH6576008.1 lysophospholipase L1-like esterase [Kitasatospora sp. MAP5-34]